MNYNPVTSIDRRGMDSWLYYPFTNCSPVILHADILLELLLEFNFSGKYQYYVTPGYIIRKSYCNFKYSPGYII